MRPPQITGGNRRGSGRPGPPGGDFNEAPADHGGEPPGAAQEDARHAATSMRPPQITGGNLAACAHAVVLSSLLQ